MRIREKRTMKLIGALVVLSLATAGVAVQLSNYLMFGIVVEAPPYVLQADAPFPATVSMLSTARAQLRAICPSDGETVYLHIQSDDALGDWSYIYFQTAEYSGQPFSVTGWTQLDGSGHVSFILDLSGSMNFLQFYLDMRITVQGTYAFTAWLENSS